MTTYSAKTVRAGQEMAADRRAGPPCSARLASDHRSPACAASNKPTYTPHMDCGRPRRRRQCRECGADRQQAARCGDGRWYHRLSGVGIKERSKGSVLEGKHPERVIIKAGSSGWCRAVRWAGASLGHLNGLQGTGPTRTRRKQTCKPLDCRRDEPHKKTRGHDHCRSADIAGWLARALQGAQGTQPVPAAEAKPKLDAQGRAPYAHGQAARRKRGPPASGSSRAPAKITVNGRATVPNLFRAAGLLRMLLKTSLSHVRQQARPIRRDLAASSAAASPPSRLGAPRHQQGADLLRAGPASGAQGRLRPDARQPRRRAQEIRARRRRAAASSSTSA